MAPIFPYYLSKPNLGIPPFPHFLLKPKPSTFPTSCSLPTVQPFSHSPRLETWSRLSLFPLIPQIQAHTKPCLFQGSNPNHLISSQQVCLSTFQRLADVKVQVHKRWVRHQPQRQSAQSKSDYSKCSTRSTESFGSRETNFHLGDEEGRLDCFCFSFIERMKFWLTSDWLGGLEQFSRALSLCFLNNNK